VSEPLRMIVGEPQTNKVTPWSAAELVAMFNDDGRWDDDPSPYDGTYSED
jgi:hypothetical protein